MKKGYHGLGHRLLIVLMLVLWGTSSMHAGITNVMEPNRAEKLTFFVADPLQYGLWAFDPLTNQRELVSQEITERYQISPDGRYIAFLANNLDRGKHQMNTVSLWVKDLPSGKERAMISDFDTDNNLDGEFAWLQTGELILEQVTPGGEKRITVMQPQGEIIWTNPEGYQYVCYNGLWVILNHRAEQKLYAYHLLSQRWQPLPADGVVLKASLSPDGSYLVYQTAKELMLLNLKTGENRYLDQIHTSVEWHWSNQETYLAYQTQKVGSEGEYYQLTVFQPGKKKKKLEVTSSEPMAYSWSGDEKQLAFCQYRNGWNLMVWMAEQSNTLTIRTGLKERTRPMYRANTHEFVYLDRMDECPAIFSYHVDLSDLRLLQVGPAGGSWINLQWTPLESRHQESGITLKFAGTGEVAHVTYLGPYQLEKGLDTDLNLPKAVYSSLKWAPNHRTLLYKSSEHGMTLFDARGGSRAVSFDVGVGELFWSPDGALIGAVSKKDQKELLMYSVFRQEMVRHPLPSGQLSMVQWMDQRVWLVEDRLMRYLPMSGEWDFDRGWKEYWWPLPRVERAHVQADSLWQFGANIWLHTRDSQFRVLTRLSESILADWRAEANEFPRWAPDDDRILYHKRLGRSIGGKAETKWQIWLTDRSGATHQYLCEGGYPQWVGNYQFVFLRDGDLWLANLVSGQLIHFTTPKVKELAFTVSYDQMTLAVVAKDQEEKIGVYFYELK